MCLLDQTRSAAADAALGQETSRIARELHDSLVRSLEGISLQAEAMVMSGKAVDEASMIKTVAGQSTFKWMGASNYRSTCDMRHIGFPKRSTGT